jgi:hypothetical protein
MCCAEKIDKVPREFDQNFVRGDAGVCRRATEYARCRPWQRTAGDLRTLPVCLVRREGRSKVEAGRKVGDLCSWSDTLLLLVRRSSGEASFM